ncbi:MAG: pilus assembly protein [Candidatus Sericytochromatia bacterium]|nr:pilus assembly protein [Candidatus Tanganyikabacteria bacterium]
MRLKPGTRAKRAGQALVETALVLPVLLGLIFGIFLFGRVYASYLVVASATRQGARLAAIGRGEAEVRAAVSETLAAAGLASGASVSIAGTDGAAGDPVTVDVVAFLDSPVPVPGLPDPVPLAGRSVMRRE